MAVNCCPAHIPLSLPLLMFWILAANDHHHTLAADDLAVLTARLDRRSYFHVVLPMLGWQPGWIRATTLARATAKSPSFRLPTSSHAALERTIEEIFLMFGERVNQSTARSYTTAKQTAVWSREQTFWLFSITYSLVGR